MVSLRVMFVMHESLNCGICSQRSEIISGWKALVMKVSVHFNLFLDGVNPHCTQPALYHHLHSTISRCPQ